MEELPRLLGDAERLRRQALHRELEKARAVRIQPHLGDQLALEARRRELQLEHEDRAEHRRGRRARGPRARARRRTPAAPSRRACGSAARRATAVRTASAPACAFIDAEQTKPPGMASTSTPKLGELAHFLGQLVPARPAAASRRSRRPSPCDAPRAHDDAGLVERRGRACRRRRPGGSARRADRARATRRAERWSALRDGQLQHVDADVRQSMSAARATRDSLPPCGVDRRTARAELLYDVAHARPHAEARPADPSSARCAGRDLDHEVLHQRLVALLAVVAERAEHVQLGHVARRRCRAGCRRRARGSRRPSGVLPSLAKLVMSTRSNSREAALAPCRRGS